MEGDKNYFPHKCNNRFLYMTFGVLHSEMFFFYSLKSAFPDDKIVLLELLFQYWL